MPVICWPLPPKSRHSIRGFEAGQRLRFRLLANPTKKIGTIRQEERQRYTKEELRQIEGRNGKRVPVPSSEELSAWRQKTSARRRADICLPAAPRLDRGKGGALGLFPGKRRRSTGLRRISRSPNRRAAGRERQKKDTGLRRSVRYDGMLVVTSPDAFGRPLFAALVPARRLVLGCFRWRCARHEVDAQAG